jgi:hypothetical protein
VAELNTILPISMPNLVFSRHGKFGGKICLVLCFSTSADMFLLSSHHNKVLFRVFFAEFSF